MDLLVELHQGLPRLGPGDDRSTRKALRLCGLFGKAVQILDIGCGSGAQSLALVADGTGRVKVTALDLVPGFLAALRSRAKRRDLQAFLRLLQGDVCPAVCRSQFRSDLV